MRVVELAGGVGGAKLAEGLAARLGSDLTVVVNTGDDLELHGLSIWPDHDTVAYTLAGLDDEERGWGLRDETWTVMNGLAALGDEPRQAVLDEPEVVLGRGRPLPAGRDRGGRRLLLAHRWSSSSSRVRSTSSAIRSSSSSTPLKRTMPRIRATKVTSTVRS